MITAIGCLCAIALVACISRADAQTGILVIGETGVGKSTLINTLMGAKVAKIGDGVTGTFGVDQYRHTTNGRQFNIWDTRGFNDLDVTNDEIMKMITTRVGVVHTILICVDLSNPRLTRDAIELERQIDNAIARGVLGGKPIIVFTKSNLAPVDPAALAQIRIKHFKLQDYILFGTDMVSVTRLWGRMDQQLPGFDFSVRLKMCTNPTIKYIAEGGKLSSYPALTESKIVYEYTRCVKHKKAEVAGSAATGALVATFGMMMFGIATGGAGFLAMAATLGGGSLAAGGAGVAGGFITTAVIGGTVGGVLSAMTDNDCRQEALSHVDVNGAHHDHVIVNGVRVSGMWSNNRPHGEQDVGGTKITMQDGKVMCNRIRLDCVWKMD